MATQEQRQALGELLWEYWRKWEGKQKRRTSQNDLARHLGVNPTSLSYWMSGTREPDLENKIKLGNKIGPRVYEVLGEPPRLPDNPAIRRLVDLGMDEDITDEDLEAVENFLNERREREKATAPES